MKESFMDQKHTITQEFQIAEIRNNYKTFVRTKMC